jgi:hypothetical protein
MSRTFSELGETRHLKTHLGHIIPLVLILTLVAVSLEGCGLGSEDVPFTVTITNDTPNTIVDHSYFSTVHSSRGVGAVVLRPGRSFKEPEYANEGVDRDRITSLSGKTLGCFPFQFSRNAPQPFYVKVTQMVPCRPSKHLRDDWPSVKY